jgi:hypothetical protein
MDFGRRKTKEVTPPIPMPGQMPFCWAPRFLDFFFADWEIMPANQHFPDDHAA